MFVFGIGCWMQDTGLEFFFAPWLSAKHVQCAYIPTSKIESKHTETSLTQRLFDALFLQLLFAFFLFF